MKMRIAIEAQRIFRQKKHGMDFVALETIRRLQAMDTDNEYFIMVAPGPDHCLEESPNVRIVEVKCPTYPLWEQAALPLALKKIKPDILHCTSNTAPVFCNTPLILTLHDIIFLEKRSGQNKSAYQNAGRIYRRMVVPRILPHCKRIITVSDFERERILSALDIPAGRVTAIHNGFSSHFRKTGDTFSVTSKYLDEKEYIFFLGNTDPKKNTPRTLAAYAMYARAADTPKPLLVADLNRETIDTILEENGIQDIRPLLRLPGYIPNKDLPAVYSGASVFLYTSLRESFGIPILEAMACGTPVVTSATSAIPEVAGKGAILVNPENAAEIAARITELEENAAVRAQAVEYGLERVKMFSWEKTAAALLDVYRQVYAGK